MLATRAILAEVTSLFIIVGDTNYLARLYLEASLLRVGFAFKSLAGAVKVLP